MPLRNRGAIKRFADYTHTKVDLAENDIWGAEVLEQDAIPAIIDRNYSYLSSRGLLRGHGSRLAPKNACEMRRRRCLLTNGGLESHGVLQQTSAAPRTRNGGYPDSLTIYPIAIREIRAL